MTRMTLNELFYSTMTDGKQTSIDYQHAAAIGLLHGHSRVATLGNNPDIDTGTVPEAVWSGASLGVLNGVDHKDVQLPATAVAMELVSDSASDTLAGVGARTVTIDYLDSTYTSKTTVVSLNGTTAVALPENVLRVNNLRVATAGTVGGNNVGNISIRASGGLGVTYGYLASGLGVARSSLYTVPLGFTFVMMGLVVSINRNVLVDAWASVSTAFRDPAGRLLLGLEVSCSTTSPYKHDAAGMPLTILPEKTDIWLRCESVSASNTNVTAGMTGYLRPNS